MDLDLLLSELKKNKDPGTGLGIASQAVNGINELVVDAGRGKFPWSRIPGKGTKGELWYRNRLYWLKTIPLDGDGCFIALHSESPVYQKNKKGRWPADLFGLFHERQTTMLCVIELKAGTAGDNVLYAIVEGARNLHLLRQAHPALVKSWVAAGKADRNAWGKGNPLAEVSKKRTKLIILGDWAWIKAQGKWKGAAKTLRGLLANSLKQDLSIHCLNKNAKPASKPHALLPVWRRL
ncbi:MAG: hypothetical protein Q8R76_06060 [Candidatus Omnitrophota bacterium]|nr:hypothetical protein [Candidatus Omnitrophota bacterium]